MIKYPNESFDRMKKIEELKLAWVIPYANSFHWKVNINEILEFSRDANLKSADDLLASWAENNITTAWRMMIFRSHWKLSFAKIRDWFSDIQVCFMKWKLILNKWDWNLVESININWTEMDSYKFIDKYLDSWDFIWVKWELFFTKHWELTIFVNEIQILSKAVRPLPEKFHWIHDEETLYRQRYLDLTVSEDTYNRFLFRSEFVRHLRNFYHENWFVEIETPILWNAASWAAAAPFVTHHNDFDEDFYLRISPETALKKATVWRFERVFEIARDFRNEWSDPSHLQEFTMVEHYAVYWNYKDNMKFTEDMFDYLFDKLWVEKKRKIKDKNWVERDVDFTTPWEKIDYIEWIKNVCWIDVSKYEMWDEEILISEIKSKWVEFEWMEQMWTTTLIDYLFKKVLRPSIIWPAIVYNYPKTMQPLARTSDERPNIVEQFQVVLNWWEIIKAYSELVDPKVQRENFDEQTDALDRGDEEATSWDEEFVLSMEYWMPPQSGRWMWIERIVSLICWQDNLRDVVLFPLMKPLTPNNIKKESSLGKISNNSDESVDYWELPSIEEANELIEKYSDDTKIHLKSVWYVMKYFANKLWEDEKVWQLVGMLHDIDWDFVWKDANRHCKDDLENICSEINLPAKLVEDIKSHWHFLTWVKPDNLIRKYICATDELTWFVTAVVRVMPNKSIDEVKVSSVKKKIKDKSFAKWVDRVEVKNCESMLWITLEDFIPDIIEALKLHKWELWIW